MRIALNMENSQAAKNAVVWKELKECADKYGHEAYNIGMLNAEDHHLTYIHLGIQAGLLLNSGAVDFVVTGCGTGEGAMMSLNAHPGVCCGLVLEPSDAFLFKQINNGNAISIPYAKGWGWAAELNVRNIFEKLLNGPSGEGYPKERAEPQACNARLLNEVKKALVPSYEEALAKVDRALVLQAVSSPHFQEVFFKFAKCEKCRKFVCDVLGIEAK